MIYNLILSGGAGLRLWPLSQKHYPKQFIRTSDNLSSFQSTLIRNNSNLIISTNTKYSSIVRKQMSDLNISPELVVLEKRKLGTALSIAVVALNINNEDMIVVSPSDLYIANVAAYHDAIDSGVHYLLNHGHGFVLFAIQAKEYNPEYGYMKLSPTLSDYYNVRRFIEKPSDPIEYHKYFYHSGIFICRACDYLAQLKKSALNLYCHANALVRTSYRSNNGEFFVAQPSSYIGEESVDHVIMERFENGDAVAFVPNLGWSDLGGWSSFYNHIYNKNDVLQIYKGVFSENVLIQEVIRNKLVLLMINDMIFFIFYRRLMLEKNNYVDRSWGRYKVLYSGDCFLIKHLIID